MKSHKIQSKCQQQAHLSETPKVHTFKRLGIAFVMGNMDFPSILQPYD